MHNDIEQYLASHLNTRFIGRQIYSFKSVESTMLIARDIARKGAKEGTIVVAEEQTAGRGRSGNTWFTPQGNLAVSIILKPRLRNLPQLIMIASLSVYYTIYHICGIDAVIKWPNDILINGKKVSGIIIENEVRRNTVKHTVIGIGINTRLDPALYPDIARLATSLRHETGKEVSDNEVCAELMNRMEKLYLEVREGKSLCNEWKEHIDTIGKYVQVLFGNTIIKGRAESVTEKGNLMIRKDDGDLAEIIAGEVTVLKE
jgi:BirA family biotin operon repressor/biotin-[acetyl-CoA-carboxylase] ligase